jgi:hypothetical protein
MLASFVDLFWIRRGCKRAKGWKPSRQPARDDEAGRLEALRPDPAVRGAHQHRCGFSARRADESLRQVGAGFAPIYYPEIITLA